MSETFYLPMGTKIEPADGWLKLVDNVKKEFASFTSATSETYRNYDKLRYINLCKHNMQKVRYAEAGVFVDDIIEDWMLSTWRNEREFTKSEDIYNTEFMEHLVDSAWNYIELENFGESEAIIENEKRNFLCLIIKTVMDYEEWKDEINKQ